MYVEQGANHPALFSHGLTTTDVRWVSHEEVGSVVTCTAKFRYPQPDQSVTVIVRNEETVDVFFDNLQKAVTPGQAAVFYKGDVCLEGGTIETIYKPNNRYRAHRVPIHKTHERVLT